VHTLTVSLGRHCLLLRLSLTQRDSICGGLSIQPKTDPGDDDEEDAGAVHLDDEVPHVTLKVKADEQGRVSS